MYGVIGACNGFKKMNMRTISKEIITKSKNNQAYAFFFNCKNHKA